MALFDYGEVAGGAIVTAALAIVLDLLLATAQRAVVPKSVRMTRSGADARRDEVTA